jgi:hypothetical protein
MLAGEGAAGAAEAGLDLIGDEEDALLTAEVAGLLQVTGRRDDDAGFTLDRLDEETDGVGVDGAAQTGSVLKLMMVVVRPW